MSRTLSLLVGLLLLAAQARAEAPLVRLAEALARQIEATAAGSGVELLTPEDRTHRGGTLAVDLRDLIVARLRGRVELVESGPRLVVTPVISESPRRLLASARVVEVPEGRLVDLLSTSVEQDGHVLMVAPVRLHARKASVEIIAATRTPPLEEPPLDLAFVAEDRLLVLFSESVGLYRFEGSRLALISRRRLPGPLRMVRAPAGIIVTAQNGRSFWALTSRAARAVLLGIEPEGLVERAQAATIPWQGVSQGLSYRDGTSIIEGPGLGPGSLLAVERHPDGALAVSTEGRLIWSLAGDTDLRVGPALALAWPGVLAAASAEPPGTRDTIELVALDRAGMRPLDSIEVEGAVRSLAAVEGAERARLVAGIEQPQGAHLLILELAPIRGAFPADDGPRPR